MTDPIKAKIQELCPDVMELKLGCQFTNNPDHSDIHTFVGETIGGDIVSALDLEEYDSTEISVLGSPITLAVVLRAIEEARGGEYLSGLLEEIIFGYHKHWNLTKDNYDDQPQETKRFIGQLLNV